MRGAECRLPITAPFLPRHVLAYYVHSSRETFGFFGYKKDAAAPAGAHKTRVNALIQDTK